MVLEQKTRLERRRGEGEGQGIVSTGTVISCRMENENPVFLDIRVLYSSGIGRERERKSHTEGDRTNV